MRLSQLLMGAYEHDNCAKKQQNRDFYFVYLKFKLCKYCVLHYMRQNVSIYGFLKMN